MCVVTMVTVTWYLAGNRRVKIINLFTCGLRCFNIDTKDPEFKEWKWEEHKKLADLAVPFKKDIYKKIINKFSNLFI